MRRRLAVSDGQLRHALAHLGAKLCMRNAEWRARLVGVEVAGAHPLFVVVEAPIAAWERADCK